MSTPHCWEFCVFHRRPQPQPRAQNLANPMKKRRGADYTPRPGSRVLAEARLERQFQSPLDDSRGTERERARPRAYANAILARIVRAVQATFNSVERTTQDASRGGGQIEV